MAAALVRFEVEHMALDHTGIPLDFDFPTLLAYEGGLIPVLRKKQPHIIAGAAVGTRALNGKLDHPAGAVLKTLYGQGLIVIRYYLALQGAENGVTAMVTPFFCVQG